MASLDCFWLGRVAYGDAFRLMDAVASARGTGDVADTLLLLEHDHVYTLGRRGSRADILMDERLLGARGIEVEETDRGGLVTYHGPGQLVGYPILDLGVNASPRAYVATLESALVDVLAQFGIEARAREDCRGVWVGDDKIAAIGVHVARGVTTHGFALNVDCDLELFRGIVACGMDGTRVASIASLTGSSVPLPLIAKRTAHALARKLQRDVRWPGPTTLDSYRLEAARG